MKTYTKAAAQKATRSNMSASYVNAWEAVSGEVTDRETAKANIYEFAAERGIDVSEVFEYCAESVNADMREMSMNGYFDF
jgi:hypothetical protein